MHKMLAGTFFVNVITAVLARLSLTTSLGLITQCTCDENSINESHLQSLMARLNSFPKLERAIERFEIKISTLEEERLEWHAGAVAENKTMLKRIQNLEKKISDLESKIPQKTNSSFVGKEMASDESSIKILSVLINAILEPLRRNLSLETGELSDRLTHINNTVSTANTQLLKLQNNVLQLNNQLKNVDDFSKMKIDVLENNTEELESKTNDALDRHSTDIRNMSETLKALKHDMLKLKESSESFKEHYKNDMNQLKDESQLINATLSSQFNKLLMNVMYVQSMMKNLSISNENDTTQPNSASCNFEPSSDPNLHAFVEGKRLSNHAVFPTDVVVSYKCADTYTFLEGSITKTCLNGTWNRNTPRCTKPKNSNIAVPNKNSNPCSPFKTGDVADPNDKTKFFKCHEGENRQHLECPKNTYFDSNKKLCDWITTT